MDESTRKLKIKNLVNLFHVEGGIPIQKFAITGKNEDGSYNVYLRYEDGYEVTPINMPVDAIVTLYSELHKNAPGTSLPIRQVKKTNTVNSQIVSGYYRGAGQYNCSSYNNYNIYD